MKYKILAAIMPMIIALPVMAEEVEELEMEEFFWGELIGALIAIVALVVFIKTAKSAGGVIGNIFKKFAIAIGLFTFSFVLRAYMEMVEMENVFIAELFFEGPLYVGMIFFAAGALKAKEIYTK